MRLARLPEEAWKSQFTPNTIQGAQRILSRGQVHDVSCTGSRIEGIVEPAPGHCVRVMISWSGNPPSPIEIQGVASPGRPNDQHVAAVFLKALELASDHRPAPSQTGEFSFAPARRQPSEESLAPLRLVYVLSLPPGDGPIDALCLEIRRGRPDASGLWSDADLFIPGWVELNLLGTAETSDASDRTVLNSLVRHVPKPHHTNILPTSAAPLLLPALAESGRCFLKTLAGPRLQHGPPIPSRLAWILDERTAAQHPTVSCDRPELRLIPAQPPLWFHPGAASWHPAPIDALPGSAAAAFFALPPLEPDADAKAWRAVVEQAPGAIPEPLPLHWVHRTDVAPRPIVQLDCLRLDAPGRLALTDAGAPLARLVFDYQIQRIPNGDPRPRALRVQGHEVAAVTRQPGTETDLALCLIETGASPVADLNPPADLPPDSRHGFAFPTLRAWQRFLALDRPRLEQAGWRFETTSQFPFQTVRAEAWSADFEEGADAWFNLRLGVTIDGQKLDLTPLLLRIISGPDDLQRLIALPDGATFPVPVDDTRALVMPAQRFRTVARVLLEMFTDGRTPKPNAGLRVDRFLAAQFAAETHDADASSGAWSWSVPETLRTFRDALVAFAHAAPPNPPASLRAQLRDYQRHGFAWLQFLREQQLGGILADDMGLGKTLQTLAHLLAEHESPRADRPSLIVAPTSLMPNWAAEAQKFAPSLRVLLCHGSNRHSQFDRIPDAHIVLTSYPLLVRDIERLAAHAYHLLVLDEAQTLRNARSQTFKAASILRARHRLALTGTPMENHLGDLWSLFECIMPGFLGSDDRFRRVFRHPIERDNDATRRDWLARRIAPFLLRRTKAAVVAELPPKTETTVPVELSDAQRDLYESIRVTLDRRIREAIGEKGLDQSHILILDALLKLRQVCCDPRLVKLDAARTVAQSAKLELLMEMVPELVEEGRRLLIFSQFTGMLDLIAAELNTAAIPFVTLTGDTVDRATPVASFQRGDVPVFLLSLKAGGAGLNLTAADTVIHYDPWWNPAAEDQASDRAHRLGQDKPVFIYKLVVAGSVEERIQALQSRKRALAHSILAGGASASLTLDDSDLDFLFGPLTAAP